MPSRHTEESVLSILLHDPKLALEGDLQTEDFADEMHGLFFATIRDMLLAGDAIDVMSVADRVGLHYLTSLSDIWTTNHASPKNFSHYAAAMKTRSRHRRMVGIAKQFSCDVERSEQPDEAINGLLQAVAGMRSGKAQVYDSARITQVVVDHLSDLQDRKASGERISVPTGLAGLDHMLGGMHKSDLIVVGARPAMGKTAWALTVATNAARQGYKVGFVSTEMSVEQVGLRLVSLLSGLPSGDLRSGELDDHHCAQIFAAAQQLGKMPLYVLDAPSCTVADVCLQAHAWTVQHGLDVLIVDYLTRLRPSKPNPNRVLEVGEMVTAHKTLARTLQIPVVLLAQLSREVEKRPGKRPSMADLRDSGMIEQEADQVAFLYRPWVYDDKADPKQAEIIVDKNRHGPIGSIAMTFTPEQMRWTDPMTEDELCWYSQDTHHG